MTDELDYLAERIGAQCDPSGLWWLPFYEPNGEVTMMQIDEWLEKRKEAAAQLDLYHKADMRSHPSPSRKEQIIADLDALKGRGPGGQLNHAYADGYFANSLERKYGKTIDELVKEVGYE